MKSKVKSHFFAATVFLIVMGTNPNLIAQSNFWNSENAYLGQKPPGDTPQLFAPGLMPLKGEFSIDRIAFSPDGKEIYYCVNTSWFNSTNLKIRYFKFDGKKWDGPSLLNEHYSAPTFSPDGKTLYFTGRVGGVVWQSHRKPEGWSEP